MNQLIILRGYPGVGKTTIGKELQQSGTRVFIDHNAILTFLARIVGNDEDIYEEIHILEKALAKKVLREGKTAIVARGFSSTKRLKEYSSIAIQMNVKVQVFTLDAPKRLLEQRVQSPERRTDFNPTVTKNALLPWIKGNQIEPFESEHIIDATRPVNTVVNEIKQLLGS